jgi:hypothetical protein
MGAVNTIFDGAFSEADDAGAHLIEASGACQIVARIKALGNIS